MKIIMLRFKNLNSLVGEWSIDFTSPEYTTDGIFAISGPTGAGKTTILDAICLALYGRTPRLKNISKATNEIMSRQTGLCFTEVIFETDEGRFKAFWSQRRGREKASGTLQDPEHELSEADTGKILASQIRNTRILIEEKTGMDYDRFIQSMMLAQGGFASFLQATGNERAPILEQITGTEIYSNISIHVFQRQKEEKTKLEQLSEKNKDMILLTSEEETLIRKNLEEKKNVKILISEKKNKIQNSITWLKSIEQLKAELKVIADDESGLANDFDAFKQDQKKMLDAKRAANLDVEYSVLNSLRMQQKEDLSVLNQIKTLFPELMKNNEAAKMAMVIADKNLTETKAANDKLLELITKVKLTDQNISQKNTSAKDLENKIKLMIDERGKKSSEKKEIEGFINALNDEKGEVSRYLETNHNDSRLITELTGLQSDIKSLSASKKSFAEVQTNLETSQKALSLKIKETQNIETELNKARFDNKTDEENIEKSQNEVAKLLNGKTLDELLREKDQLLIQISNLNKIAGFDSERTLLEDGKACPLCGSLVHPWAAGNVPTPNEAEIKLAEMIILIEKAKKLNQNISQLQVKEKGSGSKVILMNNQLELGRQEKRHIEETIDNLALEMDKRKNDYSSHLKVLEQSLEIFGINSIPGSQKETDDMLQSLIERKEKWLNYEKRQTEIDKEIQSALSKVETCDALIKTMSENINESNEEYKKLKTDLNDLKTKRSGLFGEKNTDEEEAKSKNTLQEAEKFRTKAEKELQQNNLKLEHDKSLMSNLEEKTAKKKIELDESENNFWSSLKSAGFEDEADYATCRISLAEREHLEAKAKMLESRKTALESRKADRKKHLEEETSKNLTNETVEDLSERYKESDANLTELIQETGALKEKLSNNDATKAKGLLIEQKIEHQKKVVEKWSTLNNLIGSADGKKYRNFAQGLTLEVMVSFANNQLSKLSDRYLLVRDKDEPLDLNVIDNYQAGEVRSTKNLSGGESFIVSLALALGLSRMSSRNVRVDSLFLDEGFGTLDEETLDTALGTLASLRQDGKMIGVISHVGALKDRINTKITVQPIREGRSILFGPGCKEI